MGNKTGIEWTDELKNRFWSYVIIAEPNECWLWKGGRFGNGYGQFRLGKKKVKSHRISLELALGRPLGDGMRSLHACDNPPCCNPAHLFEGTISDNAKDCYRKGRGARFNLPVMRGESNPSSKLCTGQVLEIRALRQSGMRQRDLADKFGISQSQVGNIVRGRSWQI